MCLFNTFRNNKSLKSGLQEMLTNSSLRFVEGRVWPQQFKKFEGLARRREFLMNGVECNQPPLPPLPPEVARYCRTEFGWLGSNLSLGSYYSGLHNTPHPSEKKCTDKKLRVSKAQFLDFLARVSELKVPLRDKADGI